MTHKLNTKLISPRKRMAMGMKLTKRKKKKTTKKKRKARKSNPSY